MYPKIWQNVSEENPFFLFVTLISSPAQEETDKLSQVRRICFNTAVPNAYVLGARQNPGSSHHS